MRTPREFLICTLILSLAASPLARAEEPTKPDPKKDAAAAQLPPELKKEKADEPVKISDAAKPVLEKIRAAYTKLPGFQMTGSYTSEWDMDGEVDKEAAEFTSSYAAPNKFRHETKGDSLFGSTGERWYTLAKNRYSIKKAPGARGGVIDLPDKFLDLLIKTNPSLLIALTDEPTPPLAEQPTAIDKGDDVTIDGKAYPSLQIKTKFASDVTVIIDPATSLLRRITYDVKGSLEQRGHPNVKKAMITIDYTSVKPEAPADPGVAFAWSPPEGARDEATVGDDEKDRPAFALIGKPAPDFELEGLDGKKVKLKDLKGQVVVLDFWATYCGPCIVAMPMLEKAVTARKDKVKAFGINADDDKAAIEAFMKEYKIGLTMLMDSTGDTARAYYADEGIPLTVILDKEGVARKVLVAIHGVEDYEKALDEVLKK